MTVRILALIALLALPANLTTVAAQERHVWQFSEFNDPANKGRTTATLTYGVPETDNVQVRGVCEARASTALRTSAVTFGADIGSLAAGTQVELRFSGGGFDHTVPGTVTRPQSEEGLFGVLIMPAHDDPLWKAMTDRDTLSYLVPGYSAATLDLRGGAAKIRQFVEACRTYEEILDPRKQGGGAPPQDTVQAAPKPSPPAPASVPQIEYCPEERASRSLNSDTPATITFRNDGERDVHIYWLDFQGKRQLYKVLRPGTRYTQPTFLTHPWVAVEQEGNRSYCTRLMLPQKTGATFDVGTRG